MRRVFLLVLVLGLLAVVVGAALAALPPGGTFTDDDGNIHEGNIEAIAAEGITKGCNPPANTLYCPASTVTRGQMAAFLTRALSLPATATDFFSDDDGTTFEGDINRLAAAGITRGCNPPTNTLYCPDGKVTRGQMAAFLVRAFGYTDNGGGDLFVDDDDSIFEADIDRLGTAGVTRGCNPPTNDRYCPTSPVLRDQMASFLARALELAPITPPPPTNSSTTTTPTSSTTTTPTSSTTTTTVPVTTTTLPAVEPPAVFQACHDGVTGTEFSLEQECVEGVVHHPDWPTDAWNDYFFKWIGPDGQSVGACPESSSCVVLTYDYDGPFPVGWTVSFWVAAQNRAPGWYALEVWSGAAGWNSHPEVLESRTNFLLSAIP